jgi:DeoR/GlpR family transcriptional regulator of sugar metabolism
MIQRQRLQKIIGIVANKKMLSVEDAMDTFQASPATIRRDFVLLALPDKQGDMPSLRSREVLRLEEKKAIAAAALELVPEGSIVMLGGGSTTLQLAPLLAERRLRIITNSIVLAQHLDELRGEIGGSDVILTGGTLFPRSGLLVGPRCVESLRSFRADIALLSVAGIDSERVSNNNELAAEVERAMIQQSKSLIVMADHSKINHRDLCHVCDLNQVSHLVSDDHDSSLKTLSAIESTPIEVTRV